MRAMRFPQIIGAIVLLGLGCSPSRRLHVARGVPIVPVQFVTGDAWNLGSPGPTDPSPALLWNGLLGVRLSRGANGIGVDKKPLGFYMIDEYEQLGEEKILSMPSPVLVTLSVGNSLYSGRSDQKHDFVNSGGEALSPLGRVAGYSQTLDMRNSVLTTKWTQETDAGGTVKVQCRTVLHPTARVVAQEWTLAPQKICSFSIKSLDYSGPNDRQEPVGSDISQSVILTASSSRVVTQSMRLSGCSAGATATVAGFRIQEGSCTPERPMTFQRVLSFGPHASPPLPRFDSTNADLLKKVAPRPYAFEEVLQEAQRSWHERWKTDIEIDGPPEDQQVVHSLLFYLRSGIASNVNRSISPFGLSSSKYNGHVFWDADIWVFPALSLLDPDVARSIPAYRLALSAAAERNYSEWFAARASAPATTAHGIKYPWESSVSGHETAPGDSRLEDHITGSVLWSLTQAASLGLVPVRQVDATAALANNYYLSEASRDPITNKLELKHVMSPDESHIGNNDLYTNLLAGWLAVGRDWSPVTSANFPYKIPSDSKGLLTYDQDAVRSYKQAAAVLAAYPLQFPAAENEETKMEDRFEPHVIANGPAMSRSLDALIWARSGNADRAYPIWRESWQRFANNPLRLFSEKQNGKDTYFATGAGGCLQALLYGFLGFRVDSLQEQGCLWHRPLLGGRILSITPHLPKTWKAVRLKNLRVRDANYDIEVYPQRVVVRTGG